VQNDIKRVVAYSTLSQLGYMTVALGASAYAAGIFHLMTHAFFKALLFLAAGSVIIALHHEQDMRRMGGLRKYMPVTYWTCLIGALALIGFPGTAGFFSKDALIEAVAAADRPGAGFAHWAVLGGVFVTALYTFRMFFLTFHGPERMNDEARAHLRESPWVVTVPLVLLAIPSAVIGWFTIGPLFGGFFAGSIFVLPAHDVLGELGGHFEGPARFLAHGLQTATVWVALAGVAAAWFFVLRRPDLTERLLRRFSFVHGLLVNKYFFDELNERFIAAGSRRVAQLFWRVGDEVVIDGVLVNGTARGIGWFSGVARRVQSGYLYHYAFAMIIGLAALLGWMLYLRPGA
jgi:NADH-quinone oxidoreductase subunit L